MKKLVASLLAMMLLFSISLPVLAQDPITITVWHTRGAGPNEDMINSSVDAFNTTVGAEKGITVEAIYQGGYIDTLTKTMQSVAAKENPQVVVLERAAGVPIMAEEGVLLDMNPYVEASGLDMDNFQQVLLGYSYYEDQLISLPYIRSTPVFYYNKTMADAAGLTAPVTIEELEAFGKALTKVSDAGETEVYGFQMLIDAAWFVQNMLCQLGSNMLAEDGMGVPALEDGTLLKVLTAWRQWVDDGWCSAPAVTSAGSAMREAFFQGKLASFFASSGSMSGIITNATEAGIEVGVAFLPTWDIQTAPTGGGNIAIIEANTTKEQQDAAWEFISFLMTDEQIALNSATTGYLPTTKTSVETDVIKELWAKTPQYQVPFEQLATAQELPWSPYKAEFEDVLNAKCSELIQDRSITAEKAVEDLIAEAAIIFGN